jgi:carbon-monoxide dehydrogenase medium subunit
VIGGATANPVRITAAEKMLTGQEPSEANIDTAVEEVAKALSDPLSDTYASGEYRQHLAAVMAKRALMQAVERANA